MRDIHCHILPGVDDGARDLAMSLEMLRAARSAGVTQIVCTPHCRDPYFDYERMRASFALLREHAGGFPLTMGFEVAYPKLMDERIALKVEHTYEVAGLCDEIARGEGLPPADVDLAWLCGLLHDIGRFEQLRQWGTFSDADSCSHAALGIQVLKDEMGSFTGDPEWAHIIERAVALHSDFRLPSGLGARERLFCTITRDADKVDILRVFNQSSCDAVLGIDPSEFSRGDISDVAFEAFGERRCLARDEHPGSLDGLVGAVCLAFELELPASRKALGDRGYLQALLREPFGLSPHFESELTQYRWDAICDVMQGLCPIPALMPNVRPPISAS